MFDTFSSINIPGNVPKDASFAMHALLVNHFMNGASYPKGGASEIALHLTQALEKMGGAVMVRAKVTQILLDEETGHAKGIDFKVHFLQESGLYIGYHQLSSLTIYWISP